jgi:sporulation protein YlmC with PRC-barrel domain
MRMEGEQDEREPRKAADSRAATEAIAGYEGRYHGCRATKLIGAKVVNPEGKDLGTVEDIAVDPDSGQVAYAVLSFGGFLGIGDKYFAIPWRSLQFDPENDEKISLAVEKSQLENAAGFDKDNWPDMANEQWARSTHTSFGAQPFWESLTGGDHVHPKRIARLSEIKGETVKNYQDEHLGNIEEIVVDATKGRIAYAVVGAGGFLDIGEELIAVPWSKLNVLDKDTVRLGTDKDMLLTGPRFSKQRWPGAHDAAYLVEVYRFYNVAPYWTIARDPSNQVSDAQRKP